MITLADVPGGKSHLIQEIEAWIVDGPKVFIPVIHRKTPGLYIRECQIPAGAMLTSMEHLTEHPFFILKGEIVVSSDNEGEVIYKAPYIGTTMPRTKRALFAIEDTIWVTVHRSDLIDPDDIGKEILAPLNNPLLNDCNPERLDGWKSDSAYQGPGHLTDQ